MDAERWLLYRLAQLWRLRRAGDVDPDHTGQRSAAAIHDYLAGLYLRGLAPATGPLCAIDLDGVLECDPLGYPATSPSGVLALRALIAHGYQPVLATGRSLPEVRDRCAVFGLAGGVAEYGAALVCDGQPVDLLPPAGRALLEAIREELSGLAGRGPGPAIPLHGPGQGGGRRPAARGTARGPGAAAQPGVRVVHGQGQTDFVWAGADKGTGLRALAARLSQPGCALAVGDTASDLPLFECAALARAPRNARLGAGGSRDPAHQARLPGGPGWTPAPTCSATAPASARPATRPPSPRAPRRCSRSSTCARTAWPPSPAGPPRRPDG